VVAFDQNYVLPAAVCLRSVAAHLGQPPTAVHVVAEGLSIDDAVLLKRQFPHAPVRIVAAESPITAFGAHADAAHATPAQFLKCLAPRILDEAENRLLYLDVDTVVLDDLSRLAQTDLDGSVAGFVRDRFVTSNVLDPGDHPYYNAGVFVTDRDRWNANRITEDIVATVSARAGILRYGDQDALNKSLRGAILPLDGRWNFMLSEREKVDPTKRISDRTEDVAVLHFCGPVKPWKTPPIHPYLREVYDRYLAAVRRNRT
jgi:lipopolysaccharide biosynthesis glycosyltransferase